MECQWQHPVVNLRLHVTTQFDYLIPSLAIPLFVAVCMLCIRVLHALVAYIHNMRISIPSATVIPDNDNEPASPKEWIRHRIADLGGPYIASYMLARSVGCLTLLGLSLATLLFPDKSGECLSPAFPSLQTLVKKYSQLLMMLTFTYSSLLSVLALSFKKWSSQATRHNIFLLLVTFGIYAYRNVWPLATYTQHPQDAEEGLILWFKIGTLFITAVIIPLFVPRPYVPVDPKDPMPLTNDEQTCSLFALITHIYLDPVVMLGARVSHLRFDQLPPLSDTDYAKNLIKRGFPHLDPYGSAKPKHLFFGILRVFRKEFVIVALYIILQAVASFASPIGLYHILSYLENDGDHTNGNSDIRPWFWIMCIFLGPTMRSLFFHLYHFTITKTVIQGEAMLTQLLFQHSLRIRFKAESANDKMGVAESDILTLVDAPETIPPEISNASVTDSTTNNQNVETKKSGSPSTLSSESEGSSNESTQADSGTKKEEKNDNLTGKINNLITTDLNNVLESRDFLTLLIYVPLVIIFCTIFLYQILGWSAFAALVSMLILFPIPGYYAKRIQDIQRTRIKLTDARVQDIAEALSVIRMIKMFGWEGRMAERITEKRDRELVYLWKLKVYEVLNAITNHFIPIVAMLVCYATYTVIMKQDLTPSKIFSSISVFTLLRGQLDRISIQTSIIIQGKVSIERMNDFLQNTELLDSYVEAPTETLNVLPPEQHQVIGFSNATFSWSVGRIDGTRTPSSRDFRLRINGKLVFKPNCINLIVGPTGSGKTSMLMALLGEMHFIRSESDSWFSLPRDVGVAYVAQESWVQNDTIRNNILLGSSYEEIRYRKVIRQCALESDLALFDAGDLTEVGEKGLTLSGGQKARVTLARAIYSRANIILLDDVLAALDVHTSSWIVDKCLRGDLVKGRTVLLVTHNMALVAPFASYIVSIGIDGSVQTQGNDVDSPSSRALGLTGETSHDHAIEAPLLSNEDYARSADEILKVKASDGKLTVAEEITEGHITWKSMKLFLKTLGGDHPLIFYSLWLTGFLFTDWVNSFQAWFLGYWGSQYEGHPASEVKVSYYLGQYTTILCIMITIYTLSYVFYIRGSIRASRTVNSVLFESMLRSTLRWLDETPTARMIARCTQDIRAVDGPIPQAFAFWTESGMSILTKLGIVFIFTPVFIVPGLAVAAVSAYLASLYLRAQLSVKREMSNARSPLLAHFSSAITGIVSIRAYGAESSFKEETLKRIDHYVRIARVSNNLNRWFGLRSDVLGALFTTSLASYLVYSSRSLGAGASGFTLHQCIGFCTMIMWWIKTFNDLEVHANSLERIQQYIDIEHEPAPSERGKPPASWPMSGDLRVENLSARYSRAGPAVLHNLSFYVKSGERIGVVGRTGSGKSSLTLSLLRCIMTEGEVYYDGILTKDLNLDELRASMTIIPQTPELLSGTLRRNLDPFEEYDDATLNNALRDAGLFALQEELGEGRITLDSNIASGGANLSIGQRQIMALARAMVRGSKLLILDEATSAVDYKTDAIIQATLRHRLPSDTTVITVAHRLQTIMDSDKIMVLDAGRIVEFDTPMTLLQKEDGKLKALVDASGNKETLYSMARGTTKTSS